MADSISPTPRNSLLGLLADALQSGHDFASRPRHPAMPETGLLSETLGIPSLARTLDRMSYGEPLTTGRGQTTRIRDDTTNALMAMAPMAQGASKAAPALGRAALSGATVGPRPFVQQTLTANRSRSTDRAKSRTTISAPPMPMPSIATITLMRRANAPRLIDGLGAVG